MLLNAWLGCTGAPVEPGTPEPQAPREVPWSGELPALGREVRGTTEARAVVHLHSPWSHDACDGMPLLDGATEGSGTVNEPCLADLRAGLCATRFDFAFVTDHPAWAAFQPYEALPHVRPGDEALGNANRIHCPDGHEVVWSPGIEDELMPVGLDRHVSLDPLENDRLYNAYDAEAVTEDRAAGAAVFVAHTESRVDADLERLQDAGITGVELFNLHAMFDPDIREEHLGLDGLGWTLDIAPFTSPSGAAEPDLFVLGVLAAQGPSLAHWDHLLARGPAVGVAGTDAHQNVLPIDLRDGDRGDSYRRMLRWFSNVLRVEVPGSPESAQAALEAGRSYVVFDVLGTSDGFDFTHSTDAGDVVEMGGAGGAGTLTVGCPTLHPDAPKGPEAPQIDVTVLKDGVPWHVGCGEVATDGPGVYRVEVVMTPYHLRPFLGDDPEPFLRPYPWIYANAIRVQ
ncbi:MAG: hypothetical protein ABMA64_02270 [Myxococcota bacterium]